MSKFEPSILFNLVNEIDNFHLELSKKWVNEYTDSTVNMKRTRVDHLVDIEKMTIAPYFLKIINDYITFLSIETIYNDFEFDYVEYDVRTRIKQKDSIVNKLLHYRNNSKIYATGKVPVNKCLNDIFGIRIVFEDFDHSDENFQQFLYFIKEVFNLKVVSKCSYEYNATHLYFKNRRNIYFPWELQIWSKNDEKNNEKSHEMHLRKRSYSSWPIIYKNNEGIERRDI